MKNKIPPVTSVYFTTMVKAYLRGTQTREEILQRLTQDGGSIPADYDHQDVTQILLLAAREVNEAYYQEVVSALSHASSTIPTREGVIHNLEALLEGKITEQDLIRWATWHNEPGDEDEIGYFDDLAVDYFCTQLLPNPPQPFTMAHYSQALKIFNAGINDILKDKVALALLFEKEKQRFLFYIGDFIQGHTSPEQLDVYLLNKFGMDHYSFPYMSSVMAIMHQPAKLPALLQMVALES
ncbi:MAG TPA: hypothetical protein VM802_29755 [Chitinophaga sp.]|uniref:hypothetical protein n=1 Tax=Chitinophaga sp. TaxID=1869181 RepID=UPI002C0D37BE|nr:hypothetical protein [Chitinophaga sp.]HVI49089.1 hypothetical protein [Chitinophaga sp.]